MSGHTPWSEIKHKKNPLRTAIELAWAAGFFEGEGNVRARSGNGLAVPKLRLYIAQLDDRYPLDRFVAAVGAGRVVGPHLSRGERRRWAVNVQSQAAHDVMERLRPYLGAQSKKVRDYEGALAAGADPVDRRRRPN